jgi:hypothetical protein
MLMQCQRTKKSWLIVFVLLSSNCTDGVADDDGGGGAYLVNSVVNDEDVGAAAGCVVGITVDLD